MEKGVGKADKSSVLSPRSWGLLFFALAAVARLVYASFGVDIPKQDTFDYDELAANLLAGDGFVSRQNWFGHEMRSWRAPLYPAFLAVVYGLAGYSHEAVRITQAMLGSATCVILFALARSVRPAAAVVTGFAAALYMPLVASASEIMTETLFAFLLVLAVYLLLLTRVDSWCNTSRSRFLTAGVAIGLAALTRPVALILWPVEIWVTRPASVALRAVWVRRSLWLSLGVIAMVGPWTARNYHVHDAFVPISTHGGFIFARSNGPNPDWKQANGWQIEKQLFERLPTEAERDRYWISQGWQRITESPRRYLRLVIERFIRFWYFFRPDYNVFFMIVLPLFLAGMWRFRICPGFDTLTVVIVAFVITFSTLLYGSARFRLPLEPFFLLFAGAFVTEAWQRWGGRRAAIGLAALVCANSVIWWHGDTARDLLLSVLREGGVK